MNGFPDDPGAGSQQQEGFEQRREILHFAMPVGVVPVRGFAGRPHREASHNGGCQIQPGMGRLRKNAHTAAQQANHHFQAGQQEGGSDGIERREVLLLIAKGRVHLRSATIVG